MQPYGLSNLQYFRQWDLSRGLVADTNEIEIGPGGATATSNFVWDRGYLRCRPGMAAYGTQASTLREVWHIGRLLSSTGSSDLWIQIQGDGTTAYIWKAAGGGTWSYVRDYVGGLSADRLVTGCSFNNEYFFCLGEGELMVMTPAGTIAQLHASIATTALKPPQGPRLVAANSSHLFLADVVDRGTSTRVPYRIYWSDTLNARIWGSGVGAGVSGIVDLADEPDAITGLYVQNENLMVFKRRTIYYGQFVGPPVFYTFRRGVSGIGCVSAATIKEWKDGAVIWLGDDGVYIGGFGRTPQLVSSAINPRIRSTVSLSRLKQARALLDADLGFYHLFLPDIVPDYPVNKIFTLNLNNGSWWEGRLGGTFDVKATSDFSGGWVYGSTVNDFWNRTKLIAGTNGTLYYFGDWVSDAGTAISCSWTSGYIPSHDLAGKLAQQVTPQTARVFAKDTTSAVTLQVAGILGFDRTTPSGPIASSVQTLDGISDLYVVGRGGPAEFLQLSMSCTGGAGTRIVGYEIGFIPEGDNSRRR